MEYVPLGVFYATVKFPSISIPPFVTGVTSVLAAVACIPLTVSFPITLPLLLGEAAEKRQRHRHNFLSR
jgi:hypothetical protein